MRTMQLDFWNNPLVVSALRVKFRRSSPGLRAAMYVGVLAMIGLVISHNADAIPFSGARLYLVVVVGIQLFITLLFGASSVGTSLNLEVINRTLDFQRIVSLSPREIMVGKLIGEPVTLYFMAMATIPLSVLCWAMGAVSFLSLLLLYVNLTTCSLMFCSLGLIHTLSAPSQATPRQKSSGAGGMIAAPLFFVPYLMISGFQWMSNPWIEGVVNTFTPIGSLMQVFDGDPLAASVSLWGLSLPSLLVAPVVQLAFTNWVITCMAQRLKRPVEPPVGRASSYSVLLLIDLLAAGVCYNQFKVGLPIEEVILQFCVAHGIASLILILAITPSQAALSSWLWRYREQQSWLRSSLWMNRAENGMALLMYCVIGTGILAISLAIFVIQSGSSGVDAGTLLPAAAMTSLFLLAFGTTLQALVASIGKSGIMWFILVLILANVVPPFMAVLTELDGYSAGDEPVRQFFLSLGPASYFALLYTGSDLGFGTHVGPLITYGILLFVSWSVLRRWMETQRSKIDRKLTLMKAKS